VARVGAAVTARHHPRLLCKQIHDLAFAFVSPLATYNSNYGQFTLRSLSES
jgi:hypothetical protein